MKLAAKYTFLRSNTTKSRIAYFAVYIDSPWAVCGSFLTTRIRCNYFIMRQGFIPVTVVFLGTSRDLMTCILSSLSMFVFTNVFKINTLSRCTQIAITANNRQSSYRDPSLPNLRKRTLNKTCEKLTQVVVLSSIFILRTPKDSESLLCGKKGCDESTVKTRQCSMKNP